MVGLNPPLNPASEAEALAALIALLLRFIRGELNGLRKKERRRGGVGSGEGTQSRVALVGVRGGDVEQGSVGWGHNWDWGSGADVAIREGGGPRGGCYG